MAISAGNQKYTTKVQTKPSPAAPIFNETFTFLLEQKRESDIKFEVNVMHKNTFTADVSLGTVAIDNSILRVGRDIEDEFEVRCESEHGYPVVGGIRLKIRLDPKV